MTNLKKANEAFRVKDYEKAKSLYHMVAEKDEWLTKIVESNLRLIAIRQSRASAEQGTGIFNKWMTKLIRDNPDNDSFLGCLSLESKGGRTNKDMISIVMPTWNRADVIMEAVNSVLEQTCANWELLICDDASTDGTKSIISQINDQRIRYIKLRKGNGAIARNHGIRMSRGAIIAFLDSDNIWHPEYLANIIDAHACSDVNIVYTGFIDCCIVGDRVRNPEAKYRGFSYLDLAYRNFIDLNTVSFKSHILTLFGLFDPVLPRQQDWDLLVRYTAHFTPLGVEKPLVLYRRNDDWGQVTKTQADIDTRSIVLSKNKNLALDYKEGKLSSIKLEGSFRQISKEVFSSIAIKISAPNAAVAFEWGDYHFACQMGSALFKYGWQYRVDCNDQWYEQVDDINLVIRGRHRFDMSKSKAKLNILWIISHPDRISASEFDDYDYILVASDIYAKKVESATKVPVSVMHQATDPDIFRPTNSLVSMEKPILFVGNSRLEYREMVRWCVESEIPLSLWGSKWEGFVPSDMICGQYIPNDELSRYYSSCHILLNDHWKTMASNGFLSNRLFDASAASACIITDDARGLKDVFGDCISVARTRDELVNLIRKYYDNPDGFKANAARAREIVLKGHTFMHRAEYLSGIIDRIVGSAWGASYA